MESMKLEDLPNVSEKRAKMIRAAGIHSVSGILDMSEPPMSLVSQSWFTKVYRYVKTLNEEQKKRQPETKETVVEVQSEPVLESRHTWYDKVINLPRPKGDGVSWTSYRVSDMFLSASQEVTFILTDPDGKRKPRYRTHPLYFLPFNYDILDPIAFTDEVTAEEQKENPMLTDIANLFLQINAQRKVLISLANAQHAPRLEMEVGLPEASA
jgi:hypothetical protein